MQPDVVSAGFPIRGNPLIVFFCVGKGVYKNRSNRLTMVAP